MYKKERPFSAFSKMSFFWVGFWFFILTACQSDTEKIPDVSNIPVEVRIERADLALMKDKSEAEILAYLQANPDLTEKGLHLYEMEDVKALHLLAQSPFIDTMMQNVERVYQPDTIQKIENDLKFFFQLVKYYYPEFHVPKIYGMVSGYGTDLVMTDSLVVVGLEFFLGDRQAYYRPPVEKIPNYIWRRYDIHYIPVHLAREVSRLFNALDKGDDNTLMSQMIWAGKAHYFMEKVLPKMSEAQVIGYTEQELATCYENLPSIWGFFVEKNLFFEKQQLLKRKFVDEAPFIAEMGQQVPGRVGQWLGWQIVRAYMKNHPEVSLQDLMKEQDYAKIFNDSKFKPQNR